MDLSHISEIALIVLAATSSLVPFARWVAKRTANTTDDALVEKVASAVDSLLAWVPRVTAGPKK